MSMPPLALLAGGLATRMRPATEKIPKALLEVAGEPFVFHQLRYLHRQGIERVVICAGFLGEMIEAAVAGGGRFGLDVAYSFDWPDLLGTGGALVKALPLLGPEFLVLYGDSYLPTAFAPVVAAFRAAGKPALMTVYPNGGRWDSSNVEFEAGVLRRYSKTQRTKAMRHIDYGLGVLRAEAFGGWTDRGKFDLADLYGALVDRGDLIGYEVPDRFYEIGSPEGWRETDAFLRGVPG